MGEGQLTFKGNTLHWKSNKDDDTGTFTIDPTKKPKHIDITAKGLNNGMTVKAIYELNGDQLKICMDPTSQDRPKEFKSKENSPLGVMILQRVKKK
jgi:uncharacterized protein (TIGR03067 family)